jgi:cysteine desulfurase/selenocysteine lyase
MAINMVVNGFLREGDSVAVTSMEHNSVMRPLRHMESKRGITINIAKADANGIISPDVMSDVVNDRIKLVIINHGSNVNGAIQDISAIIKGVRAKDPSAKVLIDAAQTAGIVKIDFGAMDIDFLAFTGHKALYGPQGTGGLIIKDGIDIDPLVFGGTGSRSEHETQPDFLPDMLESGTLNSPGIIGLAEGIRFINKTGIDAIRAKETRHRGMIIEGLGDMNNCVIHGALTPDNSLGTVSFNLRGTACSDITRYLNDRGIMTRSGLHCAPAAHRTLGTFPDGSIRVSPGFFNTDGDIKKFLKAVSGFRGKA